MSIGLETETEIEREATEKIRIEPSLIENRTRLLLMKRDNPVQGTKDLAE